MSYDDSPDRRELHFSSLELGSLVAVYSKIYLSRSSHAYKIAVRSVTRLTKTLVDANGSKYSRKTGYLRGDSSYDDNRIEVYVPEKHDPEIYEYRISFETASIKGNLIKLLESNELSLEVLRKMLDAVNA